MTPAIHPPARLVLTNGALTAFAVYEGRERIAEFVAPAGAAAKSDIEYLRVQTTRPQPKEPAK